MFGSLPGSIFLENVLKRSESSQVSCGRPQKKGYSNEYPSFAQGGKCYAASAYAIAVRNRF